MRNLDLRDYHRVRLPYPDPAEQSRIAAVLTEADDLIRALTEQLRNAERVKKSLLQTVFVRGLPSTEPDLASSRIGEVPSHWDVCTVRHVLDGIPFNGVSPESRPNPPGTPILNVGCISDGVCSVDGISYVDVDEATIQECAARRGDFFVLRGNGNRQYVATGGWLRNDPPKNCIFSDKLIRLRFDHSQVADGFFAYLWQSRSFLDRLQSKAQSGSGLWMITKRDIGREWVALPPAPEQRRIVELLNHATENIHCLQSQVRTACRVKQSLLQNLLTGRVRLKP